MAIRCQSGGEFLGQRDVQRLSNVSAELGFDVLTELQNRAGACASLLHGVPPSPPLTAICFGQQEVTPFSFFYKTWDTSRQIASDQISLVTCLAVFGPPEA